ncbi:MAG: chorismate mutase [Bacteroidota bacterium]
MEITPLSKWLDTSGSPLVISGPCSAETEDQVMETARSLAKIPQVKVFRAGIWKPRTRPSNFEGVGIPGLQWLQQVKAETGLLTTVEVANPKHVEEALLFGIDILWIGARTVVNPFSVQELSEVLRGVDIPVMVKNPLNPDVQLWLGALERLNMVGVKKLMAIHRGFYYYENSAYRNTPMWEIPIELQRLAPNLPIICDPSHISGNKQLLLPVAQKALDLAMAGLMIESHIDPDNALTDANQQITPRQLGELINGLTIRSISGSIELTNKLEELRREIDKIDAELIDILCRRMKIVEDIGHYKRDNNITILQLKRWSDIITDRLNIGVSMGLSRDFLLKMLQLVHKESIQKQTEIMNEQQEE